MKKGKKRLITFVLACNLVAMNVCAAEINDITLNAGKIKVQGSSKDDIVSYKIYKNLSDGTDINNVCEIGEVKVSNGIFLFGFTMPKTIGGIETNGEYNLEIKDSVKKSLSFIYTGISYRQAFISELNSKTNENDIYTCFEGESSDQAYKNIVIMNNLGTDKEYYDLLDSNEKLKLAGLFLKEKGAGTLTEDNFSSIYNNAQFVQYLNKNTVTEGWLEKSDLSFENLKFKDIKDSNLKKWIVKILEQEKQYELYSEINKSYQIANVLYLLNNAKYTEYDKLIEKYNSEINIKDETYYITYESMTKPKKSSVNSKLKNLLATANACKVSEFKEKYKTAIDAIQNDNNKDVSGSTGGSSGGSGGGIALITPENINPTINVPKFTDLESVEWAKKAIEILASKGVISGYADNSFKPEQKIRREEFVKMVVSAKKIDLNKPSCTFSDVQQDKWYAEYVNAAFAQGIVSGVSEDTFGIGKEITREDMAVIISRLLPENDINNQDYTFADDKDISGYAKEAVYKLYNLNKINGVGNNLFGPKQIVTRAQAAKIIFDALVADNN